MMILAVDGNNYVHVAYHGLGNDDPDRIVASVGRSIGTIMKKYKPTKTIVAFDSHPSFRKSIDPTYKANRKHKPGIVEAMVATQTYLEHYMRVVMVPTYEADDILATIAKQAMADNPVVLASSDKDLRQCLATNAVGQLRKYSPIFEWYFERSLKVEYGLTPSQWIDFQTLVGDSVDNIKGCKGIGEKRAMMLLHKAGTLDQLLRESHTYGRTLYERDNLAQFRERADTVRRLVALVTDVPGVTI